jgi:hypothetical protein
MHELPLCFMEINLCQILKTCLVSVKNGDFTAYSTDLNTMPYKL